LAKTKKKFVFCFLYVRLWVVKDKMITLWRSIAMQSQYSFDPDDYNSHKECLAARKEKARGLKSMGYRVELWTLPNQQRGYSGLGTIRDLSTRSIYMLNVY
jgi:hypothetical protein